MKIQNFVIFVEEKIEDKYAKDKRCCKVRDRCHYIDEYRVADLKCSIPKEIPIIFLTMIIMLS